MKNADKPIYPVIKTEEVANTVYISSGGGLTKREYFAAMAMQGEIASQCAEGFYGNDEESMTSVASKAIKAADALLKALDKKDSN